MSRSEHGAAGSPVSETSPSLFSGLSLVCPRDVGATAGRAGVAEAAEAAEEAAEAAAEGEELLLVVFAKSSAGSAPPGRGVLA